jgi:hypothetical protein
MQFAFMTDNIRVKAYPSRTAIAKCGELNIDDWVHRVFSGL